MNRRRTGRKPAVNQRRGPRRREVVQPKRRALHRNGSSSGNGSRPAGPLDTGVLAATAILACFGIVMVYSATAPLAIGSTLPPHFVRHLVAVAVALACGAIAVRVPIHLWRRVAIPLWGLSVALLALTLIAGVDVNGARRWLAVPGTGLRLQAAEFAKWTTAIAVVAMTAGVRDGRAATEQPVRVAAGLMLPPAALLMLQPDFGSAAVLAALVGLVLFVAGVPLVRLLAPALAAVAVAAGYVASHPYALARMRGFLDPWARAGNEGFQLVQSFVAFGRGGSFGVGLGDGRQKLFYLPEAHTDFVLSVVAEELGLLGVLAVLGAFGALVVAGTRIAGRANDSYAQLLAFTMTAFIAVPGAVNAAVVMGILPTTGFTLPFISFGANSLIMCSVAVGILLSISSREGQPRRHRVAAASPRGLLQS